MSKFFDFCDKHAKALNCILLTTIFVCLLFPIIRASTIDPITAPYFVVFLYDSRFASQWIAPANPFNNWTFQNALLDMFGSIFLVVGVVLLLVNIVLTLKRRKPLNFWMLLFFALHAVLASITARASVPNYHYESYYVFEPFSNAYVFFILFFLYIIYLLLRRYYAPVKARIQASRAERQANRKPTKDERIAELERKVAELESKDKDEQ